MDVSQVYMWYRASANVLNSACVTKWSSPKDLNMHMNLYLAVRMIGNIIGPVFMVLLAKVDFTIFGFIHVKDTTSPGYIMMIPNLMLLIMSLTMFTEPDMTNVVDSNKLKKKSMTNDKNESKDENLIRKILLDRGAWFPLLLQFTGCFNIGVVETSLTPITSKLNWSTGRNSTCSSWYLSLSFVP